MVGYAEEATVQTNADGSRQNAGWWPEAWKNSAISNTDNCYACISSSIQTKHPKTGKMRYWRSDESFGHGLALMVDDIGTGAGSKGGLTVEAMSAVLPPTAVVATSPGNHQLWYFFDEPEERKLEFKSFLTSFADQVLAKGGDRTIKDISRYGRMPVGVNNKRLPDGSFKYPQDFRVSLVSADYSLRYSIKQIASAFKVNIIRPVKRRIDEREQAQLDSQFAIDHAHYHYALVIANALKMGESSGGAAEENGSGSVRIRCPWSAEHSTGDAYGAYFRGPKAGAEYDFVFGCSHDTCKNKAKRTWSPFVDKLVMPVVALKLEQANVAFLSMGVSDFAAC